jgi:periplasmic iron binding protein
MKFLTGVAGLTTLVFAHGAAGKEYLIGHQLHERDMQIYANYLSGVEIAPMPPNMPTGADVIHLEADIHATGYGVHGIPDGGWIPYLKVQYSLVKLGTSWKAAGELGPTVAKDGLHYGNNVRMDGPGDYQLVFQISPPSVNGLVRHTDAGTGVPEWWKPFSADFEFTYPKE